jgi:hypothetical protein
VKEELDNYSWTVPKYSLFEPLDNRQGSIFLWKVGVSLRVNGKGSICFKYLRRNGGINFYGIMYLTK